MSVVHLQMRLRCIEDFFTTPDIDPFSDWYGIYSGRSGVEYVLGELSDTPRAEDVRITIRVPRECLSDGLALRLEQAIDKYCAARLRDVEETWAAERYRNLWMLAFAVVMVTTLVVIGHALSAVTVPGVYIVAEGLSIASWVLLWHPLENLVFTRWERRLDRRVLTTLRECTSVQLEPLDADASSRDLRQCAHLSRGTTCASSCQSGSAKPTHHPAELLSGPAHRPPATE